jgi:hypothetical protein
MLKLRQVEIGKCGALPKVIVNQNATERVKSKGGF